jgi:hypothetical protein
MLESNEFPCAFIDSTGTSFVLQDQEEYFEYSYELISDMLNTPVQELPEYIEPFKAIPMSKRMQVYTEDSNIKRSAIDCLNRGCDPYNYMVKYKHWLKVFQNKIYVQVWDDRILDILSRSDIWDTAITEDEFAPEESEDIIIIYELKFSANKLHFEVKLRDIFDESLDADSIKNSSEHLLIPEFETPRQEEEYLASQAQKERLKASGSKLPSTRKYITTSHRSPSNLVASLMSGKHRHARWGKDSSNNPEYNPFDFAAAGISQDIADYVNNLEDKSLAGKLIGYIKQTPGVTLDLVIARSEKLGGKGIYSPHELKFVEIYQEPYRTWLLVQLKKHRYKKQPEVNIYTYLFPELDNRQDYLLYGYNNIATTSDLADYLRDKWRNIFDWLNAEHIDIQNYTWEEAIDAQEVWHESCEIQSGEIGEYLPLKPEDIDAELSDGYKMVKLTQELDFYTEGILMGNCLRKDRSGPDYFKRYQNKEYEVYSLRDTYNKPHATIGIKGDDLLEVEQIFGKNNADPLPKYKKLLKEWFTDYKSDAYKLDEDQESIDIAYCMLENYNSESLAQAVIFALGEFYATQYLKDKPELADQDYEDDTYGYKYMKKLEPVDYSLFNSLLPAMQEHLSNKYGSKAEPSTLKDIKACAEELIKYANYLTKEHKKLVPQRMFDLLHGVNKQLIPFWLPQSTYLDELVIRCMIYLKQAVWEYSFQEEGNLIEDYANLCERTKKHALDDFLMICLEVIKQVFELPACVIPIEQEEVFEFAIPEG